MPLPARITELQDHAVGALVRTVKGTTNGMPAVRWLSVRQLRRTAADVVQASVFARFADKREAMAASPREFYRLPAPEAADRDVWVDFVADTGDGFDATFATACCLAGVPGLEVAAGSDDPAPAPFPGRPAQADLLVLGGDEVYPVASAPAYEERLNEVLRAATRMARVRHSPPVVALPGNHDWYDGLAAFRRNFCESWVSRGHDHDAPATPRVTALPGPAGRDDVGGWGAFQSRSYFAVQLSPRWWLWGLDSQLDAPIDAEQLAYFHDARRLLGDADVILCTASPSWLEAGGDKVYAPLADTPFYTLLWFIDRVLGPERGRVRLVLTGDQHHYARYVAEPDPEPVPDPEPAPDPAPAPAADLPTSRSLTSRTPPNDTPFSPQLVTCGGGGAFLASTHHLPDALTPAWQPWPTGSGATGHYRLRTCFPSRERSRSLIAFPRFLAAGWRNGWSLPLTLGAVDFVLALALLLDRPVLFWATTLAVTGFLALYAASGTKELRPQWRKRTATGVLLLTHIAAHVGAALLVAYLVNLLVPPAPPALGYLLAFALAAVLGTTVFVSYLRIADWWGSHTLEAFSGLRIADYKSHLRLRVADDRLEVHVVGIDRVPATRHVRDPGAHLPRPYLVESFTVYSSGVSRAPTPDTAPATSPAR
jgi:hypothetical protein